MTSFTDYALAVYPFLELEWFHRTYYRVLEAFAHGRIRRLMITMPPQHGKSVGATTLLPAYLLGLDPDLRIGHRLLFGGAGLEVQPPRAAHSGVGRIRPALSCDDDQARREARQLHPHGR